MKTKFTMMIESELLQQLKEYAVKRQIKYSTLICKLIKQLLENEV